MIFLSIAALLLSCKEETQGTQDPIEITENTILLRIAKKDFSESSMILDSVHMTPFPSVITAIGIIEVPPNGRATVNAFMGGYVKDFPLLVGDQVRKGQKLLTLENLEFLQLQQDFLETRQQMSYLQSEYERQKQLYEEKINSQKVYLKAQNDYENAKITHQALKQKLIAIQIDPENLNAENMRSTTRIESPISGSVSRVFVNTGSFVDPSNPIMEIVNATHLHLEIQIFEKDAIRIVKGQRIIFRVPEYSDKTYAAEVHLIGKSIDQDRTVQVHAHLDEKNQEKFIPGMFIQAEIMAEETLKPALREAALTEIEERNYVFELVDESESEFVFRKTEVNRGRTLNGFTEVDLSDGDREKRYLIGN
ncbi:MAG: efflux RND transporter periplasmic adaptor subunit [Lutimonas sp.]